MNERQVTSGFVRIRLIALGATLVLAVAAITVGVSIINGKATASEGSATAFPTNAKGLSYGSCAFTKTPEEEPDLILVEADNGMVGYCYRKDLSPVPHGPEEAEALMEQSMKGREIPVYTSDGVTQIGVFTSGGSDSEVTATSADGTIVKKVSNYDGTITTTVTKPDGTVTKTTE